MFDIRSIEPIVLTGYDHNLIDRAIREIKKPSEENRGNGTGIITNWCVVDAEGEVKKDEALYCYAGMSRRKLANPKFLIARMMHDGGKGPGDEVRHAWINYIINRSPYSPVFVAQDRMLPDDIANDVYGMNVCRTDVPANLLVAGLTAVRMAWEYQGGPAFIWHELVKAGCDEDLAYPFAFQVRDICRTQISTQGMDSNHTSWTGTNFSKEMVKNYLNWQAERVVGTYLDQCQGGANGINYRPICGAWGMSGGQQFLSQERDAAAKQSMGEKKKSANPFIQNEVQYPETSKFIPIWAGMLMEKCADLLANREKEQANVA